jgi:hypothetical protein
MGAENIDQLIDGWNGSWVYFGDSSLPILKSTIEYGSASADKKTLLVVTTDHETGCLSVVSDPEDGEMDVLWSTDNNMGKMVPIYSNRNFRNPLYGDLR